MGLIKRIKSEKFWDEIERKRFGIMPLSITAQSCMGSIAVGLLLELGNDSALVPLMLVSGVTMGANAVTIAQTSMKSILFMFGLTFVVSFGCIGYYFLLK